MCIFTLGRQGCIQNCIFWLRHWKKKGKCKLKQNWSWKNVWFFQYFQWFVCPSFCRIFIADLFSTLFSTLFSIGYVFSLKILDIKSLENQKKYPFFSSFFLKKEQKLLKMERTKGGKMIIWPKTSQKKERKK